MTWQTFSSRGFYVFQESLGSPLQFHPAIGTSELDRLVDAYLPHPASPQDKRAAIAVDFFQHSTFTGESVKFYQLPGDSFESATSSPRSCNQDSGYGSSFTPSPVAPTWSWDSIVSPTIASTPSTTSSSVSTPQLTSRRNSQQPATHTSSSSRHRANDFSHLPGMKILTRDGRDVTNTATRGCKTKEQREHAHLMRIMKACESCKKKKVRCDPSHRNSAESVSSPAPRTSKQAPKLLAVAKDKRSANAASLPEPAIFGTATPLATASPSFECELLGPATFSETASTALNEWDELFRSGEDLGAVAFDDFNYLPDIDGHLSSALPQTFASPFDLANPNHPTTEPLPYNDALNTSLLQQPQLPYLGDNHSPDNYVDFNLYSPASICTDLEDSVPGGLSDRRRIDSSSPTEFPEPPDRTCNETTSRPQANTNISTAGQSSMDDQNRDDPQVEPLRYSPLSTAGVISSLGPVDLLLPATAARTTASTTSNLDTGLSQQRPAVDLDSRVQSHMTMCDRNASSQQHQELARLPTIKRSAAGSYTVGASNVATESTSPDSRSPVRSVTPVERGESSHELPGRKKSGTVPKEIGSRPNHGDASGEDEGTHLLVNADDPSSNISRSSEGPVLHTEITSHMSPVLVPKTRPSSLIMDNSPKADSGKAINDRAWTAATGPASSVTRSHMLSTPALLACANALVSTLILGFRPHSLQLPLALTTGKGQAPAYGLCLTGCQGERSRDQRGYVSPEYGRSVDKGSGLVGRLGVLPMIAV